MNNFRVTTRGGGNRDFSDQDSDPYNQSRYSRGAGAGSGGYAYHSGAMRNYGKKKPYRGRGQYKPRGGGAQPRSYLDEDQDMWEGNQAGSSQNAGKRYSPYGSRKGPAMDRSGDVVLKRLGVPISGRRGSRSRGRSSSRAGLRDRRTPYTSNLVGGPTAWFKVTLPHGRKYDKDYLLQLLTSSCSYPFVPKQYRIEENNATFLIQDSQAAESLQLLSGTITTDKGFKLYVSVKPWSQPQIREMTPEVLEKVKILMSSRYDPATKSLNLSALGKDEALKKEGIVLTMYHISVVKSILGIINEHIPELEGLNLQSNSIRSLQAFSDLHNKAPNVTRLDLGHNEISHVDKLGDIAQVQLVELNLDGNAMCDKYPNEDAYVSAIRKKFPKVMRLDGHDLPAPITFDIETNIKLPPSQGNYFGSNEQVQGLVCQFIQQYFRIYDDSDRTKLVDAYHEQATFTLSVYTNEAISGWQPRLSDYHENRNLLKDTGTASRAKKLLHGRNNVLRHISQLPNSTHDLNSFVVDVVHLSSAMLMFSINGLFKEALRTDSSRSYTRSFSRVFVTIPQGAGICILNEELTITNATTIQAKKAFKAPQPTVSSPVAPSAPASTAPPAASPTPEQQTAMVQQFSTQSGMNLDWSLKCLQENKWNYDMSAKMFTDLQAKGSIPPEAFVK